MPRLLSRIVLGGRQREEAGVGVKGLGGGGGGKGEWMQVAGECLVQRISQDGK